MTNDLARWPTSARRRERDRFMAGVAGALGFVVMLLALAAGVALAVVFAATLAVVTTVAGLLLALTALAWRLRPRAALQRAPARPVGHAWIAYGLDRPLR